LKRKVIYVSYVRLSDKTSRDWYIDYLLANGVDVEYWDTVALVREEYFEAAAKVTDYLRTLRTFSEFETLLRLPENKNAIYVINVSYFGKTVGLFRLLSRYDCRTVFIAWGAAPLVRSHAQKWLSILTLSTPMRLITNVYERIKAITYKKMKLVKPFDIVFAAGQVILNQSHYAKKVVPINLCDYDQWKTTSQEGERVVAGRHAVFLDSYLPHHSDGNVLGWPSIDPNNYYKSLNRFFDLLEKKHGLEIVIAAHPRADYPVNPFNARKIFYGRTPELAKYAEFAILHCSLAQCYQVLNFKPMIFTYTYEMASLYRNTFMLELYASAAYLNAAIYNIDTITQSDQVTIRDVDPARYDAYKYDFLTSRESEHFTTQEIFLKEILNL